MLKMALLITGTIRNYKENYLTWKKHLLDLYDVDIFFHTYNISGYHNDIYNNKNINTKIFNENEIINLLNPKKYIIDDFTIKLNEFKKTIVSQCLRNGSPKPEFIKAQLYSIYQANNLKKEYEKENNIEYDIVIKIRFDTIFNSNFDVNDIKLIYNYENIILCGNENIKVMKYKTACENCINNFNKQYFVKCIEHSDISDIVLISKSNIIDFYANIYNEYDLFINIMFINTLNLIGKNNIDKYQNIICENNKKIYYNIPNSICPYPEKILPMYLKNYTLLNYSMKLDINRNIAQ